MNDSIQPYTDKTVKVKRGPKVFMTKDSDEWKNHPIGAEYKDCNGNSRIKTGVFDIVGPEDQPKTNTGRPQRK